MRDWVMHRTISIGLRRSLRVALILECWVLAMRC